MFLSALTRLLHTPRLSWAETKKGFFFFPLIRFHLWGCHIIFLLFLLKMLEHWTKYLNIKVLRDYSKIIVCKNCLKHVSPLLLIPSLLCDRFQSHLELNQETVKVWGLPEGKPPDHHHWLIDNHLLLLCFQSLSVQCLPLRGSNMFRYLLHTESIWTMAGYIGLSRATNRKGSLNSRLPFSPVISLSAWMSFYFAITPKPIFIFSLLCNWGIKLYYCPSSG